MRAWHFLPKDKRLKYGDNRKVVKGRKIKCDPDKLELCEYGLHASVKALDALPFLAWSDAIICRVELSGKIIEGENKCVASERKVIAWCDADAILHQFACKVALDVLPFFENQYPDDLRPRQAIETKLSYLQGKATIKELDVAVAAAAYAANAAYAADAANAAAAYAANAAAAYAAYAAYTARAAYAANAAYAAAATYAAKDKYNAWLEAMFREALGNMLIS